MKQRTFRSAMALVLSLVMLLSMTLPTTVAVSADQDSSGSDIVYTGDPDTDQIPAGDEADGETAPAAPVENGDAEPEAPVEDGDAEPGDPGESEPADPVEPGDGDGEPAVPDGEGGLSDPDTPGSEGESTPDAPVTPDAPNGDTPAIPDDGDPDQTPAGGGEDGSGTPDAGDDAGAVDPVDPADPDVGPADPQQPASSHIQGCSDDCNIAACLCPCHQQQEEPKECTCDTEDGVHAEGCPLYVAPQCTCGSETDVHKKGCPLYVAPSCTCNPENGIHASNCPLYVAPVTADVYVWKDGKYQAVANEESQTGRIDVDTHKGQTLYVLEADTPQILHFWYEYISSGNVYGAWLWQIDSEDAALETSTPANGENRSADLTLPATVKAGDVFTLSVTKGSGHTPMKVTIQVIESTDVPAAKVYDAEYAEIKGHGKDSPLNVKDYDDQTIYVLASDEPQTIYFERVYEALGGTFGSYGAKYEIGACEYAALSQYGDMGLSTYQYAALTLAPGTPSGTEIVLTAGHAISGSETVTIKVLDKLPKNETTVSATVGEATITVSGNLPKGVTLTATKVGEDEYHTGLGAFLKDPEKNKLLFAYDVSLVKDGEAYQPSQDVTVTLDVSGVENGDKIGILHDHEGELSKLGNYPIKDGKVSFETDTFSVFYGYTVDFEYNGAAFSMVGGGRIFLYELFAQLDIERSTTEIEDVTFSNPNLIAVSKVVVDGYTGETDWCLDSLSPFTSQETLSITFSDGETIEIGVTDATYSNLENSKTYGNGDVINGATVSGSVAITLNGTVTVGGTIVIPAGGSLTIKGSGTLKRGDQHVGDLFQVTGGTLKIEGNSDSDQIVIDGGADWTATEIKDSTRKLLNVTKGAEVFGSAIYVVGNGTHSGQACTLDLKNVTLQDLYTKKPDTGARGAAIYSDGQKNDGVCSTITMDHVTVKDCATRTDNCIVVLNDSKATMTDCVLTNNCSVNRYSGTVKAGGPDQFCQLTMKNCSATGNYSSGWGGVILWAANNTLGGAGTASSKATISGCTFTNNTARYLGGAISNEAIMEISGTTITNNTAMAGGGVAAFPFTRTLESDAGGNACGLTLGTGNRIEKNVAYASGVFTPFNSEGQTADTDEPGSALGTGSADNAKHKYTGGGGGVWCYMNKEKWTCSLEIGIGNTIKNNTSKNVGGGVYVDKVAGEATTLSITGAEIIENKAVDGGGIAVKAAHVTVSNGNVDKNIAARFGGGIYVEGDMEGTAGMAECTVSGSGSVSENTAANGGGIYIDKSCSLTVDGGLVTKNKAVCGSTTHNETTAMNDGVMCGVGGGIYVASGEDETTKSVFNMTAAEGSEIGIYSNTADYAAADVYASGTNTTLTLPEVAGMDLKGMTGVEPTGWYADYHANDEHYPGSTILVNGTNTTNPGRYDPTEKDNVKVDADHLKNTGTYFCLTLGLAYGDLTITKQLKKGGTDWKADEDLSFIFDITCKERDYHNTVVVTVPKGRSTASITVKYLMEGTYTVTEQNGWSWRFTVDSKMKTDAISAGDTQAAVTFTNTLSEEKWLDGNVWCQNIFKEDGVVKPANQSHVTVSKTVTHTDALLPSRKAKLSADNTPDDE